MTEWTPQAHVFTICSCYIKIPKHCSNNIDFPEYDWLDLALQSTLIMKALVKQPHDVYYQLILYICFLPEYDWLDSFCPTAQAHFERSVRIYEHALQLAKTSHVTNMADIVKRLANALNELGVFYMNLATQRNTEKGRYTFKLITDVSLNIKKFDIFG